MLRCQRVKKKVEIAAKTAGIHDDIIAFPEGYDTLVGERGVSLSGGQKQRVAVAGIIALRPEIIILDESTSMLDPTGRQEIMRVIHEIKEKYQLTVLSITHDLDEAASSDRILVMKAGKIIKEAAPSELFATSEDMVEIGLDVPFSSNLMKDLRKNGFDLPEKYLSEDELVELLADKLR